MGKATEEQKGGGKGAGKQLFGQEKEDDRPLQRKRKSKGTVGAAQTPDLNIPAASSNAIVPVGLVNARLQQMDGGSESSGGSMIETLKKQKRGNTVQNARLAAAVSDSPRRAQ